MINESEVKIPEAFHGQAHDQIALMNVLMDDWKVVVP
jgi:hypothetical protein